MFAEERQSKIASLIQKHDAVSVSDLVEQFGVSVETIRRDLLTMEKQGLLKRVHGGAVGSNHIKPYYTLEERCKEFSYEKRKLSKNAMAFIQEDDSIMVDEGSTANCFAEVLKENFSRLTVVTHSMDVFQTLAYHKDFRVILCAGQFLREENAFYGALTLDMLDKLRVSKAFIFPSAVSLGSGIADYQADLYYVQRKMIACADRVFVLADSSKFEKTALLKVSDMKKEYCYITDNKLSNTLEKLYKENDITIFSGE